MILPNQGNNFTLCLNRITIYIHSFKHCLLMMKINNYFRSKIDEGDFQLPDGDLFLFSWLPELDEQVIRKDFGMEFNTITGNIFEKG